MAQASIFVELAQAIEARLLAAPKLAGGRVWRDRLVPVISENQDAIVIRLGRSVGERAGVSGPIDWHTIFTIECYSRARADELPTERVDATVNAVFERLATVGPALMLGVEDVLPDPAIEWDLGEGQTPQIVATFTVRVVHRSQPTRLVPWN